jgi:hypothetical protein
MAGISLSYCQLIKIVLSQIGGNPLQQTYTQLSQGSRQLIVGTGIPAGLAEVRSAINTITTAIRTASGAISSAQDYIEAVNAQLYINPIAAAESLANTAILFKLVPVNTRISVINAYISNPNANPTFSVTSPYTTASEELTALGQQKSLLDQSGAALSQFKIYTDRLSGVGILSGSEAAGGCSLQDLLGNGCTPNDAVPDVDLKALIEGLKRGELIEAVAAQIRLASGYDQYVDALTSLKGTIESFNTLFDIRINEAAIRAVLLAQINQIVYNLLSGCSGEVLDLTLTENTKSLIAPYVAILEDQRDGTAYIDPNGNVVTVTNATVTLT